MLIFFPSPKREYFTRAKFNLENKFILRISVVQLLYEPPLLLVQPTDKLVYEISPA